MSLRELIFGTSQQSHVEAEEEEEEEDDEELLRQAEPWARLAALAEGDWANPRKIRRKVLRQELRDTVAYRTRSAYGKASDRTDFFPAPAENPMQQVQFARILMRDCFLAHDYSGVVEIMRALHEAAGLPVEDLFLLLDILTHMEGGAEQAVRMLRRITQVTSSTMRLGPLQNLALEICIQLLANVGAVSEARELLRGKISAAEFNSNMSLAAYLAVLECSTVATRAVSFIRQDAEDMVDPVQVLEELATNPLLLADWVQEARLQVEGSRLQTMNDMLKTAEDRLSYAVPNNKESAFLHGLLAAIYLATGRKKDANKLMKTMVAYDLKAPPVWELATGYMMKFQPKLIPASGLEYFEKWMRSDPCNTRLVATATTLQRFNHIGVVKVVAILAEAIEYCFSDCEIPCCWHVDAFAEGVGPHRVIPQQQASFVGESVDGPRLKVWTWWSALANVLGPLRNRKLRAPITKSSPLFVSIKQATHVLLRGKEWWQSTIFSGAHLGELSLDVSEILFRKELQSEVQATTVAATTREGLAAEEAQSIVDDSSMITTSVRSAARRPKSAESSPSRVRGVAHSHHSSDDIDDMLDFGEADEENDILGIQLGQPSDDNMSSISRSSRVPSVHQSSPHVEPTPTNITPFMQSTSSSTPQMDGWDEAKRLLALSSPSMREWQREQESRNGGFPRWLELLAVQCVVCAHLIDPDCMFCLRAAQIIMLCHDDSLAARAYLERMQFNIRRAVRLAVWLARADWQRESLRRPQPISTPLLVGGGRSYAPMPLQLAQARPDYDPAMDQTLPKSVTLKRPRS